MKKFYILAAILFILGIVLVGCGAASTNASSTPVQTSTSQPAKGSATVTPQSNTPDTMKLGDNGTLGGWDVQVVSAKLTMGGQYDTQTLKAGEKFLIIHVVAKNVGDAIQQSFPMFSFTMRDTSGQSYNMGYSMTQQQMPTGTVAPGAQVQGDLTYIVSDKAHNFEYGFTPSYADATTLTWAFQA